MHFDNISEIYIFKDIYKGYDCVNAEVQKDEYDEIKKLFVRTLKNKIHDRSHSVVKIAVHLDQEQRVYFREGEQDIALNKASNRDTPLTA